MKTRKTPYFLLFLFFGAFIFLLKALSDSQNHGSTLALILIFLSAGAFVILWLRHNEFTRFVGQVTQVLNRVADQDFQKDLIPTSQGEFIPLTRAIQKVSVNMSRQIGDLIGERNQLRAVLDGMIEGVLVTNAKGEIVLVNEALGPILGLTENQIGKTVLEASRNSQLHEAILEVLESHKPLERKLTVYSASHRLHLTVYSTPVRLSGGGVGCVSVLFDMTELHRLENIRKEFVANVSHELKTPLTSILGYAETLRSGAMRDEAMANRFLEKIETNGRQLKNLVEDILELSQIESGRLSLNPEPVNLKDFLKGILPQIREQATLKKIRVEETIPATFPVFNVDPKALRQILCNLLDNAVKYSPENGQIRVSGERLANAVEIRVEDTGIGISEKDIKRIFERFYRVDAARSRDEGGTGLGLSIVKHLVRDHGGEVQATSRPGEGSQFIIRFPL